MAARGGVVSLHNTRTDVRHRDFLNRGKQCHDSAVKVGGITFEVVEFRFHVGKSSISDTKGFEKSESCVQGRCARKHVEPDTIESLRHDVVRYRLTLHRTPPEGRDERRLARPAVLATAPPILPETCAIAQGPRRRAGRSPSRRTRR